MEKYTAGWITRNYPEPPTEFYRVPEVEDRDKERVKTILELKRRVVELEEENRELENEIGCMHRLGVIND